MIPTPDRMRIAELDAQRRLAEARLGEHISPVLALPTEIICHIFVDTLPTYPLRPTLFGIGSPTMLAQVCRRWRLIALSTPMLWRAISFIISGKPASPKLSRVLERRLQIFETWLSRSGSCPLSVELHEDFVSKALSPFVLALLPRLARVEYLKLTCGIEPSILPPATNHPMPLLRDLEFRCLIVDPCSPPITVFQNTPRLDTVILTNLFHPTQITLPWPQITTLVLENISIPNIAVILNQTVNLVHCRLTMIFGPVDNIGEVQPLTRMESLEIATGCLGRWRTRPFIDRLTLPSLKRLQLITVDGFADNIAALSGLMARSGCSVQELHIAQRGRDADLPSMTAALYREVFVSIPVLLVENFHV
ncbi:hypothetical protein DFH06DRAFT_439297 [Mycena polygramma]|nr:hypothetical protein DFH06DRAFT_439297 [Mycena polygramma]